MNSPLLIWQSIAYNVYLVDMAIAMGGGGALCGYHTQKWINKKPPERENGTK